MDLTTHAFEGRRILIVDDGGDACQDLVDQFKQPGAMIVGLVTSALDALLLLDHAAVIDPPCRSCRTEDKVQANRNTSPKEFPNGEVHHDRLRRPSGV